jgi:drug/metabolite transporter (DMT)-like permease
LRIADGDAFEMAGVVFWALHVILISRAVKILDVVTFSTGQYIAADLMNLLVSVILHMPIDGLTSGWWTILYIGLLSTALGYTLQVLGQKYAPATDATILLSMEAVFAALAGFVFLGEVMKRYTNSRLCFNLPVCGDNPIEFCQNPTQTYAGLIIFLRRNFDD